LIVVFLSTFFSILGLSVIISIAIFMLDKSLYL
jgi:hypothetical protein